MSNLVVTKNTSTAVPQGELIGWDPVSIVAKQAVLNPDGKTFSVKTPGMYDVMVKFNSGPQSTNMNFYIVVNGAAIGDVLPSGELATARVNLKVSDTIGIKNASLVLTPASTANSCWFTLTSV